MMPTKILPLIAVFIAAYAPLIWASGEGSLHSAEAALLSQDYSSAVEQFNRLLDHGGDSSQQVRVRLGLARALVAAGRLDEVPLALGRVTTTSNTDAAAEALLILGRAKYEAGQFDAALSTFRRVYELPINQDFYARARLAAGWALWKLNRYNEIATEIAKAGEKINSPEFAYLKGMAAYGRSSWQSAIDELAQTADVAGVHQAPALFYLGECYLRTGRYGEAKQSFQRLIEVGPQSEWADDATWGLARTAQAAGLSLEFESAIEQIRENYPTSEYVPQIPILRQSCNVLAPSVSPGYGLFDEAVGYERDGCFDAALAAYHELLKGDIRCDVRCEALWRTARLHERLKQLDDAAALYFEWLRETPSIDRTPNVLSSLARIAESTGKPDEAKKHYQRVVHDFPERPQAREAAYWLAMVAADEQKDDEAQGHLDWLLERLDKKNDTNLWLQTMCLQCQLFANSQKWLAIEQVLNPHVDSLDGVAAAVRLVFWQAEAAFRLGRLRDAAERFDSLEAKIIGVHESWVPMVSLRRAQLASRREDWTNVLDAVNRLDEKYPEFELAYECDYLRGRALAGRGEMSSARTAYGDVLENEWAAGSETAAMAQWMIGESYFHQCNYELAGLAYQKVVERHDYPEWQARAALQAGKCAELCDNWDEAADLYANALERWQGSDSTTELSARLQWVREHVARRDTTIRR